MVDDDLLYQVKKLQAFATERFSGAVSFSTALCWITARTQVTQGAKAAFVKYLEEQREDKHSA